MKTTFDYYSKSSRVTLPSHHPFPAAVAPATTTTTCPQQEDLLANNNSKIELSNNQPKKVVVKGQHVPHGISNSNSTNRARAAATNGISWLISSCAPTKTTTTTTTMCITVATPAWHRVRHWSAPERVKPTTAEAAAAMMLATAVDGGKLTEDDSPSTSVKDEEQSVNAVSYTHLTLPTIYSV